MKRNGKGRLRKGYADGRRRTRLRGRDQTRRTLLKDGDTIASGDIIEVVMSVKTKNDVEYLMLSDPKPAGCESQDIVSGYAWMGTVSGSRK